MKKTNTKKINPPPTTNRSEKSTSKSFEPVRVFLKSRREMRGVFGIGGVFQSK